MDALLPVHVFQILSLAVIVLWQATVIDGPSRDTACQWSDSFCEDSREGVLNVAPSPMTEICV